jgi:RimJ/RimL family protein N-acetyltransferase
VTEEYLFTSERLGFRNWREADTGKMAVINCDERVMEFFPGPQSVMETRKFIRRMQTSFGEKGYCYWAVDILETMEFIGFIGLIEITYPAHFTPATDIGWRLDPRYWNRGYATEGAIASLNYGFDIPRLPRIVATAPEINLRSQKVMKKAGMRFVETFVHPKLADDERLKQCVLYEIENPVLGLGDLLP